MATLPNWKNMLLFATEYIYVIENNIFSYKNQNDFL